MESGSRLRYEGINFIGKCRAEFELLLAKLSCYLVLLYVLAYRNTMITLGGIPIAKVRRGLVNIDPYNVQIAAGGALRYLIHELREK